jgi:hypothetical protein
MKDRLFLLIVGFLLIGFGVACGAQKSDVGVSNFRMARDQAGTNATTTFSPSDTIYAVVDLANTPRDTKLEVRWIAVDAENTERNKQFDTQTFNVANDGFTGSTYFQLSNAAPWPKGQYRVDLYVNDTLTDHVEFNVK